ncbi:glycine-rich RNA-binding, abscisic acid-inducible protein-like [Rhagoletis pomonella]|uniref:glycine-rich RNA-binding, abscisic acid-inducible protein-like n=1 Tax=Rhagoletis pomonella TaxID=28610 RepID=UPI0017858CF0|nr:glycine-rich RNA-binding, abscisic acid-inducible protein-like [Rhagoletis pomonella]
MRKIAIVLLALLACSSAYPVEEETISVQVPESAEQALESGNMLETDVVTEEVKDVIVPEASQIGESSAVQQLLEVDAGVPANVEARREARQFLGGFGGFGRYSGYGGYGGYGYRPYSYGGYGGFGGYRRPYYGGGFGYPYGGFYG